MSASRLFTPLKVGNAELLHRIAMAPLTRYRAGDDYAPTQMVAEYYGQRASTPGTLIISEATAISLRHSGNPNAPGIYNDAQVEAWRRVTDAVHAQGSRIFLQMWGTGRATNPKHAEKNGFTVKGPSPIAISPDHAVPEALTTEEIKETVQEFVNAAKNAIRAGFDGVELHGANGYLIDEFIQDVSNQRTDEYGGSIENRSRFAVEIATSIAAAIGADRTAIRLSPFSKFQSMHMKDPVPQYTDLVGKLNSLGLAYLHLVEPRVSGHADVDPTGSLNFIYDVWNGPIVVAGGFTAENAQKYLDQHPNNDLIVAFGRSFVSTPDLVFRLKEKLPFNDYDRTTFYTPQEPRGYIDQPFSEEFKSRKAVAN